MAAAIRAYIEGSTGERLAGLASVADDGRGYVMAWDDNYVDHKDVRWNFGDEYAELKREDGENVGLAERTVADEAELEAILQRGYDEIVIKTLTVGNLGLIVLAGVLEGQADFLPVGFDCDSARHREGFFEGLRYAANFIEELKNDY